MDQKRIDLSTDIKEIRKVFESFSKSGDICRQRVENTKKIFETRMKKETDPNNVNSSLQTQTKENRTERTQKTTIVQLSPADVKSYEHNTDTDNASDFNHIRYQIVKSKLTDYKNNDNIQLQKLLSYLNSYSLDDILNADNNIVIIEPIRSTVQFDKSSNKKTHIAKTIQHNYFCHPIRINKELLESELPTPDKVKQVRNYFEKTTSTQHSNQSSNKAPSTPLAVTALSKCQNNDEYTADKNNSQNSNDNIEIISESVMQKIRDQGTSVTYFGGEIVHNDNSYQIMKVAGKNNTDYHSKFDYDLKKFQNGSQICNQIEFEPYEVQQS